MSTPREVYRWTNGMVMVFDEQGQQIADLQGPYEEVVAKIVEQAVPTTHFYTAAWKGPNSRVELTAQTWAELM